MKIQHLSDARSKAHCYISLIPSPGPHSECLPPPSRLPALHPQASDISCMAQCCVSDLGAAKTTRGVGFLLDAHFLDQGFVCLPSAVLATAHQPLLQAPFSCSFTFVPTAPPPSQTTNFLLFCSAPLCQ